MKQERESKPRTIGCKDGEESPFEIDSDFWGVKYEIKDNNLVIKAKKCGILAVAMANVPAFCDEMKNIAKLFG